MTPHPDPEPSVIPHPAWVVLACAHDIEPGTSAGTQLFGRELVIWRDRDGASHVWEDRCPHRGMRLSLGFVRGNHIACLYHGWSYDTAGQCRAIPAHPDLAVPETIRVPTYASFEAGGLIHAWSEPGTAPPPPRALPDISKALRTIYCAIPPAAAMKALMRNFADEGQGRFAGALAGAPVTLFLQPFDEARTALHVTLAGDADAAAVSRAAEALRRALEAEAAVRDDGAMTASTTGSAA